MAGGSGVAGELNEAVRLGKAGAGGTIGADDAGNGGSGGRGGDGGFGGIGGNGGPGGGGAGGTIQLRASGVNFTGSGAGSQIDVSGGAGGSGGSNGSGLAGQEGRYFVINDADLVGQGIAGAKNLTDLTNVVESEGINFINDEDWYRIVVSSERTLTALSEGATDVRAFLYGSDGETVLAENDDSGAGGTNFYLSYHLTAGTYYFNFRGFSTRFGPSTLRLSVAPAVLPPDVTLFRESGTSRLRWGQRAGFQTRLLSSNDLLRWNYYDSNSYFGSGGLVTIDFPAITQPSEFFRVVESDGKGLFAARIRSAGTGNGSVAATTSGSVLTIDSSNNFGDNPLLLDGSPLLQSEGTTIVSTAGRYGFRVVTRSPGELTSNPVSQGFPAGTWVGTSAENGNEAGGTSHGLVHFPFGSRWLGAHVNGGNGAILSSYRVSSAQVQRVGVGHYTVDLRSLGGNGAQGALLVSTAEDSTPPAVVSTLRGTGSTPVWNVGIFSALGGDSDGNRVDADWSFVYVPYTTQGIVAGESGGSNGSGNYSVRWDSPTSTYRLTAPEFSNLSEGVLLINGNRSSFSNASAVAPLHYQWSASGSEITIYPHRLPLTSETLSQDSEFVFAYFPFDRLIAEPGR